MLIRYRLDDLVDATHLYRPLRLVRALLPRPRGDIAHASARCASAAGADRARADLRQVRPDSFDAARSAAGRCRRRADARCRISVPPFPETLARAAIETALGASIDALYRDFDGKPLASASIAQVHAATLPDGRDVVVKVLRPGIDRRVADDIELLRAIARARPSAGIRRRTRSGRAKSSPKSRRRCATNSTCSAKARTRALLRRNFRGSRTLYVPEVHLVAHQRSAC